MFDIEAASSSAPVTAPAAAGCPFRKAIGSIRTAFTPAAAKTRSPFVSLSKFVVGNDKIAEVKRGVPPASAPGGRAAWFRADGSHQPDRSAGGNLAHHLLD